MIHKRQFQLAVYDGREEIHEDMGKQVSQDVLLLFVLEGMIDVRVGERDSHLGTEDVLVINAGRSFEIRHAANDLYIILSMDYALIMEILQRGNVYYRCDSSVERDGHYDELRALIRRMLNHLVETGTDGNPDKTDAGTFTFLSDCFAVLNGLTRYFMINDAEVAGPDETGKNEERILEINRYIYENYDQPVSMKDLSEQLYLSEGYLYRFFRKNFGMSFADYLSHLRTRNAADELVYTRTPVTSIAFNNGFSSVAMFSRAFRKLYGMSPTEFRRKAGESGENSGIFPVQQDVRTRLEKILTDSQKSSDSVLAGVSEGVFCAQNKEKTDFFWEKVINFGAADNLLHSADREQLMILHQAVGFEYVRFFNIFSKAMFIDVTQETGNYNFSQIDSILDFVLEQGMKPFIELGWRSNIILFDIGQKEVVDEGGWWMSPDALPAWERLMEAFLRHLSRRYGQDSLDGWYMELWYDETWRLNPEKFNEIYLAYFNATWKLIRQCNDRIRFGGYSIRMDAGADKRRKFLSQWSESECRPDFISIMYYGYLRGEDELDQHARKNMDPDSLLHFYQAEEERIREAGFTDVPVMINEWNLTPSVRNFMNDSTFKAAYIVKNTIDLYGKTTAMAYGAGTDRSYSFFDTTAVLYGGPGLLTSDSIMKPAAFAYEFMNHRLFPYFMGKNRHMLATSDGHGSFAVLCHNQQQLNYKYYLTEESMLDPANMDQYYEGKASLTVRIRITDIADGTYKIKVYRINEGHGSVLHLWGNLEYEKDPSREDIKYLRRSCEPGLKIRTARTNNGQLMIEEELAPNEIAMIRIHRAE